MFKKYLKCYGYFLGLIIIMTLLLSIINYFIPFKANTIKLIIPLVSMFIASIIVGKNVKTKGYLEGIKFSSIYIILIIILKIILKGDFNYKVFIMYFCLFIASLLGAMLGINIKKE